MKTLLFTLFFVACLARVVGQTPTQIIQEYRSKAETACHRLNATLQAQGAAIAADLVAKGDTAGAADISKQIEAKLKGEPVGSPHHSAATLFTQYDAARASALKPLQAASIQRIEAMLKTSAGKDMKVVLELATAREEIEGGKLPTTNNKVAHSLPEALYDTEWTWERPAVSESIFFSNDGTFKHSVFSGNWTRLSDREVELSYGKPGQVRTVTLRFNGSLESFVITAGDKGSSQTTGKLKRNSNSTQASGKVR